MKKLLAILLAMVMVITLAACKTKAHRAADNYLEEMKKLKDKIVNAANNENEDKAERLYEDLEEMLEDGEEIYDDLSDEDEDIAEEFRDEVLELVDIADAAMEFMYDELYGEYY